MKTSKLAAVIRKIVREEVQREVRNLLTEKKSTSNNKLTLSEALTQTETEAYPTMGTFDGVDARAGFAAMQDGSGAASTALIGHNGQVVSADKVDPSVTKALTRDYSALMKKIVK